MRDLDKAFKTLAMIRAFKSSMKTDITDYPFKDKDGKVIETNYVLTQGGHQVCSKYDDKPYLEQLKIKIDKALKPLIEEEEEAAVAEIKSYLG